MLRTVILSKTKFFYCDTELKTIARFPSNSNLLAEGSDNSLYFGMTSNEEVCSVFKELFNKKKIEDISGLTFFMNCQGSEDKVDVKVNINKEGQIQIKICKNGTMYRLTNNYSFSNFLNLDFTKMLFVIDFLNLEIRFKDPNELRL